MHSPILEPNLYRPFGHVDLFRYPLTNGGCGCRILVEFHLERGELVLCGTLSLLVLLLLSKGAFARGAPR